MLNKITVAERQLDTAIRLFFENADLVSSYTLASASREITDDLCEAKSDQIFQQELARVGDAQKVRLSFREELRLLIKPEFMRQAFRLSKRTQNFFKHADRDSHGEIAELSQNDVAYVIFFAIKNFVLLEKRWTPAMSTFVIWFGAANPNLILPGTARAKTAAMTKMRQLFSDLHSEKTFSAIYESLG